MTINHDDNDDPYNVNIGDVFALESVVQLM